MFTLSRPALSSSDRTNAREKGRGLCVSSTRFLIAIGQSRSPSMLGDRTSRGGVIVIDTGETAQATMTGYFPAWHPHFRNVAMQVTPEQEIGPQLQAIGIHPGDVRWVILTHLHTDHAGGLRHFPKSEILVIRRAFELASGFTGQMRGFLPHRWPSWFAPKLIDLASVPFGVFPSSYKLTDAGDILI